MSYLWRLILGWLAALSADPTSMQVEAPRSAAAVLCARASMLNEVSPNPQPQPKPKPECCGDCKGTGYITHGDGHKTPCPCPASCKCKQSRPVGSQQKQDCVRCNQAGR